MSGADPRTYTAALGPNQAFFVSTYFKQLNLHPSSQDTIGRASRHPSTMDEVRGVLGNDFAPHTVVTAFYLEQPTDLWGGM